MARQLGLRATAARETIAALCEQRVEPDELLHEVSARVRRVVPYDWSTWGTTDPETLLATETVVDDSGDDCELASLPAELEAEGGDVNHFDDLDRAGTVAATLLGATGGDVTGSPRHRRLFAPRGLHDELRLLARSGDATWAVASLARATDADPFSAEELAFVGAVAADLGEGLRRNLARTLAAPADGAPGVLVVDAEGELAAATPDGRRWLDRLPNPYGPEYLPPGVEVVTLQARAVAAGARALRPARMRVRLPGEGWLHVRAEVLEHADGAAPSTVVTLEPAGRAELLPVLVALYGLTARERAVATLLVGGHETAAVAERLGISRHTLRDHVKAIFAKTGVRSRAELTALLGAEVPAAA